MHWSCINSLPLLLLLLTATHTIEAIPPSSKHFIFSQSFSFLPHLCLSRSFYTSGDDRFYRHCPRPDLEKGDSHGDPRHWKSGRVKVIRASSRHSFIRPTVDRRQRLPHADIQDKTTGVDQTLQGCHRSNVREARLRKPR